MIKKFGLLACVIAIAVCLSYIPADAGVYRSKVRTGCSGVATIREYSRGRVSCSGVSRSRARSSCSGVSRFRSRMSCAGSL